ncbi:hypothetical protein EFM16_16800, partial [Lactiplantibacillus plantarum]|nr:hypothetical protein [Lactiplantibacillus plantarum]
MTETQVLVINADRPDIDHPLAMGPEPEMFKLTQHNYKSGEWPFPVTAMELNRVKDLVHKYSLPLTNDYWRAEKYNNPDEVIAYQTLARLCKRIGAPEFSIRQASMSNG